jgi:hypothetical protein
VATTLESVRDERRRSLSAGISFERRMSDALPAVRMSVHYEADLAGSAVVERGFRCFARGCRAMRIVGAAISAMWLSMSASADVAQGTATTLPLNDASRLEPHNVTVAAVRYRDSAAVEVRLAGPYRGPDRDTFAFIPGLDFRDGTIEVDVAGSILPTAPPDARGFIGIAFRIDPQNFACEGLYIRPANGRADDQVRRNHATQYFSYPGYDFDRLRREAPAKYESYADMVPGEWTHLRIEVSGATARLYVGAAEQPVLIVNDLKRGADAHGSVGLFAGIGTDAHFRNLSIR